jgi:hypothetical protein
MEQAPLTAIIIDDPAFLDAETDFDTVVCDDGVTSILKLLERIPDLAIQHARLGDQAVGQEILTQLRAERILVATPVIVYSADSQFICDHCSLLYSLEADVLE